MLSNYILVVPQEAFSKISMLLGDRQIGFEHYSNASVLIERQQALSAARIDNSKYGSSMLLLDHTDRGGTHFQQICDREDILFIGAVFSNEILLKNRKFLENLQISF